MSEDPATKVIGRLRGQFLFAAIFLGGAALLLSQLGNQTTWANKTDLVAQPGFWPALGVGGMVLFGGLHLFRLPRRRLTRDDWQEGRTWLAVVEFAAWFLVYVVVVPLLGYLPTTLIFMPVLLWRLGYRSRGVMAAGVLFGGAIVVVFKTFLNVRIPGGAVYEFLPDAMRNIFIVNF